MRSPTLLLALMLVLPPVAPAQEESDPMAEAMKLAQPGPPHEILAAMAGTWKQEMKILTAPGQPMAEVEGKVEARMILGDRFLQIRSKSRFWGEDVESLTTLGHDNRKGIYTFHGIDSMGTYAVTATGTYDNEKKVLTFEGVEEDVPSGTSKKFVFTYRFESEDRFTTTLDFFFPDGTPLRIFDIVSTRQ